jgi:hypothetical protein
MPNCITKSNTILFNSAQLIKLVNQNVAKCREKKVFFWPASLSELIFSDRARTNQTGTVQLDRGMNALSNHV